MDLPAGRGLTALAFALICLAAAATAWVAYSGSFRPPAGVAEGPAPPSLQTLLGTAREAERNGDLAAALFHYRAAVSRNPRLVDRRSPDFLGLPFEEKVKAWASGLRDGKIRGGARERGDASYLFRRMYGGCG